MFGIVGYGIVGKSTHKGILNNADDVKIYDINIGGSVIENLKNSKYAFFCIPTNDHKDVETLIDEIKKLKALNKDCLIIVRSTVPLGTCEQIEKTINEKIIYIPEFVRDRIWEKDCVNRPIVVGHNNIDLPDFILNDIFVSCSLAEAELLKMFSNNFAALKIVFANHMYDLACIKNANYNKVIDIFDQVMINQSYIEANENLRGFGGKCLPKDLDFIIDTFNRNNINQTLFDSIKNDNEKWKITVRKF